MVSIAYKEHVLGLVGRGPSAWSAHRIAALVAAGALASLLAAVVWATADSWSGYTAAKRAAVERALQAEMPASLDDRREIDARRAAAAEKIASGFEHLQHTAR